MEVVSELLVQIGRHHEIDSPGKRQRTPAEGDLARASGRTGGIFVNVIDCWHFSSDPRRGVWDCTTSKPC